MSDTDRTTALGLARYAVEFYEAAVAADEALEDRPEFLSVPSVPVLFLTAHSIELILKSYLRHRGYTLKQLSGLNHNLKKAWEAAVGREIEKFVVLNQVDVGVLGLISDLHSSTELRYIVTGAKIFPSFGALQDLTEKLLDAIGPEVGYRSYGRGV